ncbi:MAG: SPOR domain-containing protein [Campylobacterales bacterium]|nr:SPOR domain-containing protein [Campylobacterales bacterium]HEO98189.1 SPOR domain-containing protein [Campylobacterota bacterium]
MNDHNLDDLIIDDIQPNQSNKAKSFLTIIALAIVVLIVSIIFTKILLKDPKQDQLLFEQNETEMISSDLTLQSVTEPEGETSEPLASSEEEEDLLDISKETVPQKVTEEVPAPVIKETAEISEVPQQSVAQELEVETEKEPAPAGMPKAEEEKATDILDLHEVSAPAPIQPTTKEKVKAATQQTVRKSTEEVIEEQKTRPANVLTNSQTVHARQTQSGSYYIQVGAFSKVPSQRFLDRISQNGFNYTFTNKSPRGLRKLIIGPYPDRKSAERALVKVKDRINKSAFLVDKK